VTQKRKEVNNPKNSGHYVPAATPKGIALSLLRPILKKLIKRYRKHNYGSNEIYIVRDD
jgi:hypothetical protein